MRAVRLLAVSDEEEDVLVSRLASGAFPAVDAVVSCGDLRPGYLDYVATMAKAPLLYVRGNHDTDERGYDRMGGTPLDMRVVRVGGLNFCGLDGSYAYREGIVGFSEGQMWRRCALLAAKAALHGGIDVLVTHAPPRGHGDLGDLAHRGFECFNALLGVSRPRIMLCGHVHLSYGIVERERVHPCGTRIINAYQSCICHLDGGDSVDA